MNLDLLLLFPNKSLLVAMLTSRLHELHSCLTGSAASLLDAWANQNAVLAIVEHCHWLK